MLSDNEIYTILMLEYAINIISKQYKEVYFKEKLANQIISLIFVLTMVFATGTTTFAAEKIDIAQKAESEKEIYGEATDETAKQLHAALETLGVKTGSYSGTQSDILDNVIATRGYGQPHDLGKGWTYRVDRPFSDSAKPHVQ